MRKAIVVVAVLVLVAAAWWFARSPEPEVSVASGDDSRAAGEAQVAPQVDPLELPPSQLSSVSGRITGPDGEAVPGAQACMKYAGPKARSWLPKETRCEDADAQGNYVIDKLVPSELTVFAQAPEFRPAFYVRAVERGQRRLIVRVPAASDTGGIDIQLLYPGVKVEGVVEDLSGGVIEGATVSVSDRGWQTGALPDPQAFTRTNDKGEFTTWAKAGTVSIRARADGYGSRSKDAIAPGSRPVIRLTPESVIEGVVVDAATKAPVPGVMVKADRRFRTSESVRSDEAGRFRIGGLGPGRYSVSGQGPKHYGQLAGVVVNFAGTTEVTVQLHPAQLVEGTVTVQGSGEGCEAPNVSIEDAAAQLSRWATGDSSGYVRMEGVLPGSYQLRVSCEGYVAPEDLPALVVEAGKDTPAQRWTVTQGKTLHGVAVDASGAGAVGVTVSATFADSKLAWGGTQRKLVEAEDGSWTLHGVRPGKNKVQARRSWSPVSGDPQEVEVPEAGDPPEVKLLVEGHGTVRGIVRDEDGAPVAGATVRAQGEARRGASSLTTDDGEFEIKHVPEGRNRVTAARRGKSTRAPGTGADDRQGELVDVAAGQSVELELVVEAAGGVIRGRIFGSDGQPAADAFVSASRIDESATKTKGSTGRRIRSPWGNWGRDPKLSDQNGDFSLEGLPEGRYVVRGYHKEGGDALVEDVELGANIELRIPAVGRIAGKVVVPGGEPPASVDVRLVDNEQGVRASSDFYRTDGAFAFEGLVAGTYDLTLKSTAGDATLEGVELVEGGEVADLVIELERKVALRGRLVDDDTGEPIAGMRAHVSLDGSFSFSGGQRKDAPDVSDETGHFVLESAPASADAVTFMPVSSTDEQVYSWASVPVEIPPEVLEFDMGDIPLLKSRTKRSDRRGDLGYKLKDLEPGTKMLDREFRVAVVTPGGPAAKAGLVVGDVIVGVDGRSVTGEHTQRYYVLTRVTAGTKIVLEVEGGRTVAMVAGSPLGD